MDRAIGDEISSIKEEMEFLNRRIFDLEIRFDQQLNKGKSEEFVERDIRVDKTCQERKQAGDLVFDNTVTIKRVKPVEAEKNVESTVRSSQSEKKENRNEPQSAEPKEILSQSLEEKIGSYWLNRVGIFSLVIGLALLLMYSFQFYGPVFKVLTGILIGFGLIAGGEWMDSRGEPSWYVRGLIGGGWSIAFFTAFAVYHVPAVKLTDNLLIDCLLMSIVCLMAMAHAVWRKSELIAGLACVLTLIVIGLADINQFSWCAQAILITALAYMSSRFDWYKLFFWGVIGSYGTFYFSLSPKITAMHLSDWGNLMTALSYVGVLWIVFNVSIVFLKTFSKNRKVRLITAAFINAAGFIPLIGVLLNPLVGRFDWVYPLAVSLVYASLYMVTRKRRHTGLDDLHMLVSLTSFTHAIAVFFGSSTYNLYWMLEIPALVWLGKRYNIASMRVFALLLTVTTGLCTLEKLFDSSTMTVMGLDFPAASYHFLWMALALAATASILRVPSSLNDYGKSISNSFYFYLLSSAAFFWMLPVEALRLIPSAISIFGDRVDSEVFRNSGNIVFWTVECAVYLIVAFLARDRYIKYGVCTATTMLTLATIFAADHVVNPAVWMVIAFLTFAMLIYRKVHDIVNSDANKNQFYFYFSALAFLIWSLAIVKFSGDYLAFRWALEAAGLVALGFWFSDRNIRGVGGVIFATAIFNLTILDTRWILLNSLSVVLLLYVTASMYRLVPVFDENGKNRHFLAHVYEVAAAFLLTMFVDRHVPTNWITFAWSAEGLAFLTAGFLINDKIFRISGLTVFGLVALKLLFVDLAGAETIARIFSFIVAGVILLIASYAYTKFASKYMNASSSE